MQSVMAQAGWCWCPHVMAVTHDSRPGSNAAACTQPSGGAVRQPKGAGCTQMYNETKVNESFQNEACG